MVNQGLLLCLRKKKGEKGGRKKDEVGNSPSSHTEQPSRNKAAEHWE